MEVNPSFSGARTWIKSRLFSFAFPLFLSFHFYSYLPASYRPAVSSSPSHQLPLIILISFFARHFVTPDATESASRYRSRWENRQSNYAKNKPTKPLQLGFVTGKNIDGYIHILGKESSPPLSSLSRSLNCCHFINFAGDNLPRILKSLIKFLNSSILFTTLVDQICIPNRNTSCRDFTCSI